MEHKVYGCKVNKFYLNKTNCSSRSYSTSRDDIFLVATCVVTDRAKSKRVKEILDQLHQDKRVYIAGCGSITKGEATDRAVFSKIIQSLHLMRTKFFFLQKIPAQKCDLFYQWSHNSRTKASNQKLCYHPKLM